MRAGWLRVEVVDGAGADPDAAVSIACDGDHAAATDADVLFSFRPLPPRTNTLTMTTRDRAPVVREVVLG